MNEPRTVPAALARTPISAPVWLWIAYALVIITLGLMTGSVQGFASCWFVAAFSFQFWTFATWRGLRRQPATSEGDPT